MIVKITENIFQNVNPITPQRIIRSSFKGLLLPVYGSVDGHKPLLTLRVHIDIVFDALKLRNM